MEPKEWRATVKSTPVFYASPACPPLPFAGHLSSFKAFSHHLRPRKPAFLDSPAADGFAVSPYLHQGTKSVSQVAYRYGHPPTSLQTCTNVPPNVHMRARNFGNALSEFRPIRRTCRHFVSHLRLFPCRMFLSSETVKNFQFFQFFQFFRLFASFWFFESFFPHVSYLIFPQTV